MTLEQRIEAFANLGTFFKQFSTKKIEKRAESSINSLFFDAFKLQIERAQETNGWFTKENVLFSIENWSEALSEPNLKKWLSNYDFKTQKSSKTVAVIMAGNIPFVGFHDFLSVLISGHKVVVKLSSNDKNFLPLTAQFLINQHPLFKEKIVFTDEKLNNFDAIIATGSNNTARYFEHYFGNYPHIIRKNRNSAAILTGNETLEELEALGEDILRYFGLGCRSISKIFVPENYNFDLLFNALFKYKEIINYKKYENNYDYNKAVFLMSLYKLLENGFMMLKEDASYASPIATLHYEYYNSLEKLKEKLKADAEQIQCVVSGENELGYVKFGQTQHPKLWDYADNVDTIKFLLKL